MSTILAALDVLEAVARVGNATRLSDISRTVGMPKSRVYRILRTLASRQYIYQDAATRMYGLGVNTWLLCTRSTPGRHLLHISVPLLERLQETFQETVFIALLAGVEVLYIYAKQGRHPLQSNVAAGTRGPLYATATGKAMLAFQPDAFVNSYLDLERIKFTPSTIVAREALVEELEGIRARGYAVSIDEWYMGVGGVGAPILDQNNVAFASIGLSLPTSRLKDNLIVTMGAAAEEVAQAIVAKLRAAPDNM